MVPTGIFFSTVAPPRASICSSVASMSSTSMVIIGVDGEFGVRVNIPPPM